MPAIKVCILSKGLYKACVFCKDLRIQMKLKHILLIYREMIPSIRLCGHCQLEYLAEQEKAEYRCVQEMKLKAKDLNWADIILLGRWDSWYEYRLAELLKNAGKYLAYIIDDDLLNVPHEISSAAYFAQEDIQNYIRGTMELCDCIISPSPRLLEKYSSNKKGIQIEEPVLFPVEYVRHDNHLPVRIGFAGSIDRAYDIEDILRQALINIKDKYGESVEIFFYGVIPSFASRLKAVCIPYTDSYDQYRKKLNEMAWDIGLAPMPDTPFHACKHYNKFIEYAAAGAVGVFSDVYPYTRLKGIPDCAVFCDNSSQSWERELSRLIEDDDQRERYREQATRCSKEYFSIPLAALALERDLLQLSLQNQYGVLKDRQLISLRLRYILKRLIKKTRNYGIRGAFRAALKKLA